MTRAVIIGHDGQDGRHLVNLLQKEDYSLIGIGSNNTIDFSQSGITGISIHDQNSLIRLMSQFVPDEIYYLAAYHHSSQQTRPNNTFLFEKSFETNVYGLVNTLEAIRNYSPATKLFYASSSHIFGHPELSPQNELTPRRPVNIYGISKSSGMSVCEFYRDRHSVFASSGILYNHESEFRREHFVSQKIVKGAWNIVRGRIEKLEIADLGAMIDWGYAADYVKAMRALLQLDAPEDCIIATGKVHTVREFVEHVFDRLQLNWQEHIETPNPLEQLRPSAPLCGDASKLHHLTGWELETGFDQLIDIMIHHERKAP